jgi:hypothetical protein
MAVSDTIFDNEVNDNTIYLRVLVKLPGITVVYI